MKIIKNRSMWSIFRALKRVYYVYDIKYLILIINKHLNTVRLINFEVFSLGFLLPNSAYIIYSVKLGSWLQLSNEKIGAWIEIKSCARFTWTLDTCTRYADKLLRIICTLITSTSSLCRAATVSIVHADKF